MPYAGKLVLLLAGDAEAWALARLRLQRFRLNTADAAAHDFVGQVFSAAAVGLGARPDRHRQTAWSLRAAAGS